MTKSRNRDVPAHFSDFPVDVVIAAVIEDAKTKQILRAARKRPQTVTANEKSLRENAALMSEFHRGSAAALMRRIESKELITKEELIELLGGNRRWFTAAVKSERLFSIPAPSGITYFPAFYADLSINRRALGSVAKVLSGLPAASKYHFFVSKSFRLGTTPLKALADERVEDVLAAAAGFATR
jgi:hypothetical protein